MIGATLRYAYEVRNAKEYFDEIPDLKVPADILKLAEHILETKAADFDPTQFVDHYEEAVVEMLKKKQAGMTLPTEKPAAAPQNVVNLMDALRRSIAHEGKPAAAAAKPKAGKKRAEGQREMLLPIAGKSGAKDEPRKATKPAARRKAE